MFDMLHNVFATVQFISVIISQILIRDLMLIKTKALLFRVTNNITQMGVIVQMDMFLFHFYVIALYGLFFVIISQVVLSVYLCVMASNCLILCGVATIQICASHGCGYCL